jgi:nucleoside-diphosphate-sugar epimerase
MKILLTGAAGFTGLIFSAQAEQLGHVVAPLMADITDQNALTQEVNDVQPDAVVHLAGISFVGHADSSAFYQVNVIGTTNLLSALAGLTKKPSCVLLASSANIYGNCDASPITEQQPPAPVNHYAMSKLAMEHMALTFADRLPIVMTRPFNYVGIGQAPQFLIPKLVDHFLKRAPVIELGNIDVEREFNDVRMVCDIYLKLLQKGESGQAYNVCSGQTYSLKRVIKLLEGLTHHSIDITINQAFVRPNEVHKLCGSPDKLVATIGPLEQRPLSDTLSWMLAVKT